MMLPVDDDPRIAQPSDRGKLFGIVISFHPEP
jgi:hypothetical protein